MYSGKKTFFKKVIQIVRHHYKVRFIMKYFQKTLTCHYLNDAVEGTKSVGEEEPSPHVFQKLKCFLTLLNTLAIKAYKCGTEKQTLNEKCQNT